MAKRPDRSTKSSSTRRATTSRKKTARDVPKVRALASTARAAKSAADVANAGRAKELLSLIRRRKSEIVEAFYDIGEALLELSKRKHYEALGCASFQELLEKHGVMGKSQAFKLIKIVKNVPRDTALELGQEKAYAMIALAAATPERDTVAELAERNLGDRPLRDVSTRAIAKLASETREAHRTPTPKQRERQQARRAAIETLRRHFASFGLRGLSITGTSRGIRVELSVEQAAKLA